MADDERKPGNADRPEQPKNRFPETPSLPDVPEAPRLEVKLPPRPGIAQKGAPQPGAYRKLAIASTAASAFVAPILVMGVGGYLLDKKMNHQTAYFAFAGTVLGFIVGIIGLMRIIKQLNE